MQADDPLIRSELNELRDMVRLCFGKVGTRRGLCFTEAFEPILVTLPSAIQHGISSCSGVAAGSDVADLPQQNRPRHGAVTHSRR